MSQLAIKGHATRGREVIQLLEMLGGKNIHRIDAIRDYCVYFVMDDKNKTISSLKLNQVLPEQFIIYSLEEFEERFPYKVGDKVQRKDATSCGSVYEIVQMKWEDDTVKYTVNQIGCDSKFIVTEKNIKPFKEETMELNIVNNDCNNLIINTTTDLQDNKVITFRNCELDKVELDLADMFKIVLKEGKYYVVRKEPQYPKTYEECCKILDWNHRDYDRVGYKSNLLCKLQLLILCRDAYWEIAGEAMGLGKPWEPDWYDDEQGRYAIMVYENKLYKDISIVGTNFILVFPTMEMRDTFYENFKDLIEQCKELL